jgi:hypothetical protein
MILNLPNVSLLGLNQSYRFLGGGFNYSNSKELSIEGSLNDLTNSSGISGTWSQVYDIKSNPNFESVTLNGFDFGSGRLLNASFPEGNDVRVKNYSLTIEVFETGDLFNLTGTYYSGIDFSNAAYLQDFSETFSFDKKSNGGYGYSHNASIQFNSGVGQLNAIQAAQNLAKTLFTGTNLGFAFYSGFTNKLGRRTYTESYNKITNQCEFGERFDFDSNQGNYSLIRTNNFSLDEAGMITVSENGVIKGIERPTYQNAISAIDSSLAGSYNRATGIFAYYAPLNSQSLISSPINQARSLNIFDNNLTYDISYSNNRANSGSFFWNYTQTLTKSNGISILNENGNIIGRGGDKVMAYTNAKNGFTSIKNSAFNRGLQFYLNNSLSTGIFIETQSRSDSPSRGTVDYGFTFSNESVLTGSNGVKNIRIIESNSTPVYLYTQFGIFNEKTIIQDQSNGTVGQKGLNLQLKGERGVSLTTYLSNAVQAINDRAPAGQNVHINQAEYSFDENNSVVEVNVGWEYNASSVKTIKV